MTPKSLPSTTTFTPVPDPLLGEVLNSIDNLGELKCILRALWQLHRKKAPLRCVTLAELKADPVLEGELDADEIEDAMNGKAGQGIFAKARMQTVEGQMVTVYVLNQQSQRLALQKFLRGKAVLPAREEAFQTVPAGATRRPSLFDLYEQEIGMITPLVADELKAAEEEYPLEWIETAVREAALSGKRSWPYVKAILSRWNREGKSDGKFGRHTKTVNPQRYVEEFVQRRGSPPGG